jgi:uncharacterized membrane protein YtjA (UPF0391 family)
MPSSAGNDGRRALVEAMTTAMRRFAAPARERVMLYWAVVFLIIALVAGALGFFGIAGTAAYIAKVLFFIFIIVFLVSLIAGSGWRRRL